MRPIFPASLNLGLEDSFQLPSGVAFSIESTPRRHPNNAVISRSVNPAVRKVSATISLSTSPVNKFSGGMLAGIGALAAASVLPSWVGNIGPPTALTASAPASATASAMVMLDSFLRFFLASIRTVAHSCRALVCASVSFEVITALMMLPSGPPPFVSTSNERESSRAISRKYGVSVGFWSSARRTLSRRESTADTRSSWSPYMAGSRKTRAEAGVGLSVAAVSPAVSVRTLSVRKVRRSLLLSIDRAEEEVTADREATGQLEKPWLKLAE
mmetsp:Transcript_16126/g.34086  ORF Transcript_16126/g.34086 Transcript_16126/m.34086 type:complete len:271 (-) Transcript_16126:71-883(-)